MTWCIACYEKPMEFSRTLMEYSQLRLCKTSRIVFVINYILISPTKVLCGQAASSVHYIRTRNNNSYCINLNNRTKERHAVVMVVVVVVSLSKQKLFVFHLSLTLPAILLCLNNMSRAKKCASGRQCKLQCLHVLYTVLRVK